MENFGETHIVVDMYNGRVLDFQGSNGVTFWILRVAGTVLLFVCEIQAAKMLGLKSPWSFFRTRTGTILFLAQLIMLTE